MEFSSPESKCEHLEWRINEALKIAADCGCVDGGHHKMWVIDQIVRTLTLVDYEQWVYDYEHEEVNEDGDPEYEWDTGIAP